MKHAAILTALLLTGCAGPGMTPAPCSFALVNIHLHAQIGGSRTDPTIAVDNRLAEGAIQSKDLPIDYQIKADTPIDVKAIP